MKHLLLVATLLPCLVWGQLHTKISYTFPKGFKSDVSLYTSENDAPAWQGTFIAGKHSVTVQTKTKATGFVYINATKQLIPFKLTGKATDITAQIVVPSPGDEELEGASGQVFPQIDRQFLQVTSSIQSMAAMPEVIADTNLARQNVKRYYALLQRLVKFTDSVVTLYPTNNVSLFTIFRLARWCGYSPDIYVMLGKLDSSLLKNDFAKDLQSRKDKILADSMAVAGKKPEGILQKALADRKLKAAAAQKRLLIFWDDFTRPDRELTDDVKRLHLLLGDSLQVNFVYTGSTDNWQAIVKQAGLPAWANYLRCSKTSQTGTTPVITSGDNTCLLAGVHGYYLYTKVSGLQP